MKTDLTHFHGRNVVKVWPGKNNFWQVELDGNVLIDNLDETLPAPPDEIVGTTLLVAENDNMVFGFSTVDEPTIIAEVQLTLGDYEISTVDGSYTPGVDDPESDLPPDPSPDRVADGPEPQPAPQEEMALEAPVSPSDATEAEEEG
jgi:hypothetical protein